ncbi:YfiM family protein [Aestuariibaculum sp. M13]|uniref:YfiM family protein n=1 Tax=Aestuariibaculum sp. M13 TaxID=2967132 RepID=UPI002159EA61|nr:YfiM family protein [Aestuariibaculum sp. M13]MCR8669089.1 YfiM family protein [Aestuariibaculum sp. M13]
MIDKRLTYIILFLCVSLLSFAQSATNRFLTPSDTLNTSRRNAVVISEASLAGITLVGLNQLWYADYERSKFHTINDNKEWLQMDKMGHVFTSYQIGKFGADLLSWSGASEKDQLIYGSTLGFGFLTAVEVLDGFSEEWGFSWGDIIANASGTGLYVGQQLLWNEQRILLKFSYHETMYASQRSDKLGNGFFERVLKDYNGQTYWLSVNLSSFFKESKLPKWLNLAFGYGADGMLSGVSEENNLNLPDYNRYRQYYLSLDVDLSKLQTKSQLLRTVFEVFNTIKIPFPTLEINKNGCAFHLFYI